MCNADYDGHLVASQRRYDLKSTDAEMAKDTLTHKVLTGDLQRCLPTPLITNNVSFYKTKLWTLNFRLYDSSVHCIMWDETKGACRSNETASALLKWADNCLLYTSRCV